MSPLWEELERMGCQLSRPTETSIHTTGKLIPGEYSIPGNVSSQFITGLLFALALVDGKSKIHVTGKLESKPYIVMTQNALATFGVDSTDFCISGSYPFRAPRKLAVEGDWSNAAFFLAAAALGNENTVSNLDPKSPQGDRKIIEILAGDSTVISAADIPDLVPILAVYFAAKNGAVFTDIARLRLKESDRVASVSAMLASLGIRSLSDENTLTVYSGRIAAGVVNTYSDHRIAMAAAIAATVAEGPVMIQGAECVAKSYPTFWQEFKTLGGNYEQYIR
jgi:3-phosphoshikimate 1-carboxyvinyltransferase